MTAAARRACPLGLLTIGLAACGSSAPDAAFVRIASPGLHVARPSDDGAAASWVEAGAEREVRLRILRPAGPKRPWIEIGAFEAESGPPFAQLILGPVEAVLLHHLASRPSAALDDGLRPGRLALADLGDEPTRLALVVDIPLRGSLALGEIDPATQASRLALAQVLGASDVLARGRLPLDDEGTPRLPFFVPRTREDWDARLRGVSLEGMLPPTLGRRLERDPAFRSELYRKLYAYAARLPALRAELERLGEYADLAVFEEGRAGLDALLARNAAVYPDYLDSVWVESVRRLESPSRAALALDVHSVVPVSLDGFVADLPRERIVGDAAGIAELSLRDVETGKRHPARAVLAREGGRMVSRVEFPVGREVQPRTSSPGRFDSTRLAFALEGSEAAVSVLPAVAEALAPRLTNRVSGERVPDEHVSGFVSDGDPRFGAAAEEDRARFAEALPSRLVPVGAGRADAPSLAPTDAALVVGAGAYEVRDDLLLPPGIGLVLEAGVELRVEAGRSILVRGPLQVRGTVEHPVRIRGATEASWGVLAVQGRGLGALRPGPRPRSEIRHLRLEGGSEDALRGAVYSGQLSVHHQHLQLEHSVLRDARADDALNVKVGSVTLRASSFLDNAADGVDLDWVDGEVSGCLFERSGEGGDGLDLSGSTVSVADSVFGDARDKCLSVGEESELELRGALLRRCAVGVASKDSSRVRMSETVLLDNARDLAAYQKKAIFGGGRILGERLLRLGDGDLFEGPRSEIEVADSRSGEVTEAEAAALGETDVFTSARFRELGARLR